MSYSLDKYTVVGLLDHRVVQFKAHIPLSSLLPAPFQRNIMVSQVRWYTSVVPAHGRLRQEDHKFEVSLGYIAKCCCKNNSWVY
jgi:hypothetical protein